MADFLGTLGYVSHATENHIHDTDRTSSYQDADDLSPFVNARLVRDCVSSTDTLLYDLQVHIAAYDRMRPKASV